MTYGAAFAVFLLLTAVSAHEPDTCDASKGDCRAEALVVTSSKTQGSAFIQVKGAGKVLKTKVAKSEVWPSAGISGDEVSSLSDGLGGGGGLHTCCSKCSKYCSPKSSTCYDGRHKDYYEFCDVASIASVTVGDLVWSDEFEGSGKLDNSKWTYEVYDKPFNNELQFYTDREENARREDGILKVVAKCESYNGQSFTSARLITKDKAGWGPGHRVEVRAKAPTAKGTWPAIWMMPTESRYGEWPNSGEIDIMESVGCTPGKVYGTVHTGAYNHLSGTQKGGDLLQDYGDWHTYTIDWLETQIKWYVDGQHYHTFFAEPDGTERWPFTHEFYLILNIAVGGDWGGYCLSGPPSCNSDGHFSSDQVMEVDYARVYSISETEAATM